VFGSPYRCVAILLGWGVFQDGFETEVVGDIFLGCVALVFSVFLDGGRFSCFGLFFQTSVGGGDKSCHAMGPDILCVRRGLDLLKSLKVSLQVSLQIETESRFELFQDGFR